jgi:hypothetical protein
MCIVLALGLSLDYATTLYALALPPKTIQGYFVQLTETHPIYSYIGLYGMFLVNFILYTILVFVPLISKNFHMLIKPTIAVALWRFFPVYVNLCNIYGYYTLMLTHQVVGMTAPPLVFYISSFAGFLIVWRKLNLGKRTDI